ncbi:MAG: winged helix-turn-helix domain-containing protein [Patescibacteria group bacterium]|mgnify:FL=1|uniref:winged helix-turn-helix domain-containing protein n=1 Tax=Methanospirillum sp. TaxID=45200 RepID=UPI002B67AC1B|nr:winged helix-turn-helix domain-containing protein [Methanospirillum sp.]MDD3091648.1 winged helix-turn-helix domain-containing protein [Methanoregulaceae archaeon]MDD5048509.1 winged helix-turn-helix domain-containing protein [Methanoregulaceae archaeon]HPY60636.1 winged helix-turn-helix domain-containing protein [Methanospirillum sp.]
MSRPFEGLLGNTCELRTIEFLLPMHGIEFNISELAEEMKVTRQTLSKVLKKYDEWGLVNSRVSGQAIYYSINEESPLVKSIVQFNNVLIETMLGTEELYEIREYLEERIPHIEPLFPSGYRYGLEEEIWTSSWKTAEKNSGTATPKEDSCWVFYEGKSANDSKLVEKYPNKLVHQIIKERGAEYAA